MPAHTFCSHSGESVLALLQTFVFIPKIWGAYMDTFHTYPAKNIMATLDSSESKKKKKSYFLNNMKNCFKHNTTYKNCFKRCSFEINIIHLWCTKQVCSLLFWRMRKWCTGTPGTQMFGLHKGIYRESIQTLTDLAAKGIYITDIIVDTRMRKVWIGLRK